MVLDFARLRLAQPSLVKLKLGLSLATRPRSKVFIFGNMSGYDI